MPFKQAALKLGYAITTACHSKQINEFNLRLISFLGSVVTMATGLQFKSGQNTKFETFCIRGCSSGAQTLPFEHICDYNRRRKVLMFNSMRLQTGIGQYGWRANAPHAMLVMKRGHCSGTFE